VDQGTRGFREGAVPRVHKRFGRVVSVVDSAVRAELAQSLALRGEAVDHKEEELQERSRLFCPQEVQPRGVCNSWSQACERWKM
jgi:hypothetical protein